MQVFLAPFKTVEQRLQALEYRHLRDSLTTLKNTNALINDLKDNTFSALILIDIDGFHNYNELYGMDIGDLVLKKFASYLQTFASNRAYDVYRIYGDHFVLRCLEYATHIKFEKDLNTLFAEVEVLKISIPNVEDILEIDITVGLSLEKDMALKKVKMALNSAKKRKMPYIAYSKFIDTTVQLQESLLWKNEIKTALLHNNIIPVFQPIVDRKKKIVKYEALMRLRKEVAGKEELISPSLFLEISHKSKQYEKLTRLMIEKSFAFMKKNGTDFSINLSFEDIINKNTIDNIKQQIAKYNIGTQVMFEIVESENIDDFEIVKEFISEFKELGVHIAIDDFHYKFRNRKDENFYERISMYEFERDSHEEINKLKRELSEIMKATMH